MAKWRWNGVPTCPYCESERLSELKGKTKRYKCYGCRKQFGIRVGTIFHDSKLSLRKWFIAIFIFTAHKRGISSHQLSRDLKITQKTAWFVLHRIREVFDGDKPSFVNLVEIDETYFGGKEKNKHQNKKTKNAQGRSTKGKTPVLGILERNGKVYALPVKNTSSKTLKPIIDEVVEKGTKVYTDEWTAYNSLNKDYQHEIICHSAGEYVKGDIHTNGIENFWSHFKRTIIGTYFQISDQHLHAYVNESAFRYNNRDLIDGSRFDVTLANAEKRLTYKELIARKTKRA